MRTPHITAAVLLLLFAGISFSWGQIGRNSDQHDAAASAEEQAVVSQRREKRAHDLASAFVENPNSLSDEDYQRAALAYEEQRQAERAATKRSAKLTPPASPYRRWRQRVERLQGFVAVIHEFPEGSVQWHMREELKQLLQDRPRQPLTVIEK